MVPIVFLGGVAYLAWYKKRVLDKVLSSADVE